MNYDDDALKNCSPEELIALLKKEQLALKKEQQAHRRTETKLDRTETKLDLANERIFQLRLLAFGKRSEHRDPEFHGQQDLFNEVEQLLDDEASEQPEAESADKPKKKGGGRKPFSDKLRRVQTIIDIEAHDKTCGCGTQLKAFGEDVSEKLVVIPQQVFVEQIVRLKYSCPCCEDGVKTAPVKPQLLPKSYADESLLAYLIIGKYQDSLPLARLEKILARSGAEIPRNTMARWMMESADKLSPVIDEFEKVLKQAPVILIDETRVQVNKEPDRQAHQQSYMWVQRSSGPPEQPDAVVFHYDASRGSKVAIDLLDGFQGAVVSDGYAAYQTAQKLLGFEHGYCMAHARRKFIEAEKITKAKKTSFIAQALADIEKLFAIEQSIKGKSADEKLTARASRSKPVLDKLKAKLEKKAASSPSKGAVGEAIHYMLKHWVGLTRFLNNGDMPIHNNGAENAIRPFVVGRKNWLFADTPRGAKTSAIFYSIIETAKANGHEPWQYLTYLLKELTKQPKSLEHLMPWNISPAKLIDAS